GTRVFENAAGGLYLTSNGLADDGSAPASSTIRVATSPLTQIDGTFTADSGSVSTVTTNPGGSFKARVQDLVNETSSPSLLQRIVLLAGRLDGVDSNGRVTYLGGHDYAVDLPISSNPMTNGVRVFLNAILTSDCAASSQTKLTLQKTAPAVINTSQIDY